ncbi:MAG: LPS export ABC transporter periplasmic protein LptC [Betaproteobacteria bacterium]
MNTRPLPVLPLSVLLLLVALTFWLSRFVQTDDVRVDGRKRHDADLIIENFAALKLNASGDLEYAVNAAKMMHFQDDDSSVLENVVFTAIQPNQPKVTAKAPRGQLLKRAGGADEVMMDGGVRIETEPDERYPPLMLATPSLTVIPDKNIARSSEGVVMQSPTGELTAKSFLLNTLTRRVVFEVVKLNYAARSKP